MSHHLVADIGGTNARLGLVTGEGNEIYGIEQFSLGDFSSLRDVIEHFLDKAQCTVLPKKACFAVASPIVGDKVSFTNNTLSFSIEALKSELGLDYLHVLNDFEAVARSLPYLGPKELYQIGGAEPCPHRALAVLGPGTGLGMAALLPALPGAIAIPSQGGHSSFAPANEREEFIARYLRQRIGYVSNEDLLSGRGLSNIYDALSSEGGLSIPKLDAPEIMQKALSGEDPIALDTLDCFTGILGSVAGDFALQMAACGGVYIAGGIVPRFVEYLEKSSFRRRFEAKGRMATYVSVIPTYVIMGTEPGLIGAASIFDLEV